MKANRDKVFKIGIGAFALLVFAAWIILPYDREHLLRIDGGTLRSAYNIWVIHSNKEWNRRNEAVRTNHSGGGITVSKSGTSLNGQRIAFEMTSNRVPGAHLSVTEEGEVFVDSGDGSQPLRLR